MSLNKVKTLVGPIIDFLFPPEECVREFEKTTLEDLVRILPASEKIDHQNSQSNDTEVSLFAYQDEKVKHFVWEIKYYRNQKITDIAGQLLAQKIKNVLANPETNSNNKNSGNDLRENFLLLPIPLTKKRLRERGYNHTELITRSILKYLPENFSLAGEILQKIRHTPKQNSIENREDRFQNIVGAFAVPNPAQVAGRKILIIDDVITTGATVAEVKKTLLAAGAKNVWAFSVAH